MRAVFVILLLIFVTLTKGQSIVQSPFLMNTYNGAFARQLPVYDSLHHSKWSFSKYAGLSTAFSFFKGGNALFVAAPISLQLNRRLNNNLYAFTGVSVAPVYTSFNNTFVNNDFTKTGTGNTFLKSNSFGMYSRAELGLMYINDAKTFSISGSIGVERNTMPVFYPSNTATQSPVLLPNR